MAERTMLNALDYVETFHQQQDEYVDNRATMGQGLRTGNTLVDELDGLINRQGLEDNSLDWIPGSKPVRTLQTGANAVRHGDEIANVVAGGMQQAKDINHWTNLPDTLAYYGPGTAAKTLAQGTAMGFRGVGDNIGHILKGNVDDITRKSPGYLEVPIVRDAGGVFLPYTKNASSDTILNATTRNGYTGGRVAKSAAEIGSVKKHEYNHDFWRQKYGDNSFNENIHEGIPWNAREHNPSDYGEVFDDKYFGYPWEVNARARQWNDILNKKKKTQDDFNLLAELKYTTAPYLKGFADRYPDEVGASLYHRLNPQVVQQGIAPTGVNARGMSIPTIGGM